MKAKDCLYGAFLVDSSTGLPGRAACALHGLHEQRDEAPGQNLFTTLDAAETEDRERAPPIQVPDKLVDERDLSIKYAQWMVETGRLKEAQEKYQTVLKKNPEGRRGDHRPRGNRPAHRTARNRRKRAT